MSFLPNLNAIADFNDCIYLNGLIDMGFSGVPFTWKNSNGVKQRLDRLLFNNCWFGTFKNTCITHGMLKELDNRPLLLKFYPSVDFPKFGFKFLNMWVLHPDFLNKVEENWKIYARNVGLKKLKESLLRLKQFLRNLNKTSFRNVFERFKTLET